MQSSSFWDLHLEEVGLAATFDSTCTLGTFPFSYAMRYLNFIWTTDSSSSVTHARSATRRKVYVEVDVGAP